MSKNDLQETNVAKETEAPRVSIDDIRLAIVEDKNKLMLLNIFDNLINENKVLNKQLLEFKEVKSFEE